MATINNTEVFDFTTDNASRAPYYQGQNQLSVLLRLPTLPSFFVVSGAPLVGQIWPRGQKATGQVSG